MKALILMLLSLTADRDLKTHSKNKRRHAAERCAKLSAARTAEQEGNLRV